jgi:hypothetical protein
LSKLLAFVYNHIITEASGSLISEYAKRQSNSWEKLKNTLNIPEDLAKILEQLFHFRRRKNKEKMKKKLIQTVLKILFSLSVKFKKWD